MTEENKGTEELTDEQLLMKLASAMKDNAPTQEEKQNVHTFLDNVVKAIDTKKIANLRDDKDMNELGIPQYTVRGALDMALISDKIMENDYFKDYLEK